MISAFPLAWLELTASFGHDKRRCDVTILNPHKTGHGVEKAWLNGKELPVAQQKLTLPKTVAFGYLKVQLI